MQYVCSNPKKTNNVHTIFRHIRVYVQTFQVYIFMEIYLDLRNDRLSLINEKSDLSYNFGYDFETIKYII